MRPSRAPMPIISNAVRNITSRSLLRSWRNPSTKPPNRWKSICSKPRSTWRTSSAERRRQPKPHGGLPEPRDLALHTPTLNGPNLNYAENRRLDEEANQDDGEQAGEDRGRVEFGPRLKY